MSPSKRGPAVPRQPFQTQEPKAYSSSNRQSKDFLSQGNLIFPLLMLAAVVIALTVISILFNIYQERDKEVSRLEAIADLKLGQVELWIRERRGDAENTANSAYLQELAERWRQRGDRVARDLLLERIDQTRRAYNYDQVYFYDGKQNVLQSQQKQSVIEPKLQIALQDASNSATIKSVGPFLDRSGKIFFDFIAPLGITKPGSKEAIVLRSDVTQFLYPTLNAWPYPSPSGENLIVQRDGDKVLVLNEPNLRKGIATRLSIPLSDSRDISVQAIKNPSRQARIIEGIDYRHIPSLGIVRAIEGTDWFLVTKLDLAEVNESGYRIASWIFITGLLILIFIGGVAMALRQRQRLNDEQLAIFDAATIGIVLTRNRTIERCNKAMEEIFGYEVGELIGKSASVLYRDKEIFDEIGRSMSSSIRKEGLYREERKVFRKDGSALWVRLSFRPLDPNDATKGSAGTFEDITLEREALDEMERAKDIAQQAATTKANFLANMSHEIRTPMNAVIGMTHLALKADPGPRVRAYLDKIQISSQHLLGVINDILDYSKIDAGKMQIEKIKFELDKAIENAVGLIIEKVAEKNLELILDIGGDVPNQLIGDPLRIGQVLVNYLNNAVKFTENGEIVIKVSVLEQSKHDLTLRVSVRDSGIGIAEAQRKYLFQSFQQVDSSTTRKYGGTGLGLAISKRLAEAMGGEVGFENSPGQGSTFWFTAKLMKGLESLGRPELKSDLRGRRALVVDDHEHARQIEVEMLEAIGLIAKSVSSGSEALAELTNAGTEDRPYDIVFMDWMMPEMDGVAVAEKIPQLLLKKPPIVLMITAYDREELVRAAEHAGVSDVLSKPVTPSTLFNAITQVFARLEAGDEQSLSIMANATTDAIPFFGLRALLVEDNELNQEVGVELLEDLGLSVDVAQNGAIAIEMAHEISYDIILMDMQMPVMDGIAATIALRKDAKFQEIPILAMTANVMKEDQQRCFLAGMNDHIAKPIDPDALRITLLKWLPVQDATQFRTATKDHKTHDQDLKPVLPEVIEGLDMMAGLKRVLGNRSLYESLLARFIVGQEEASKKIRDAILAGDMDVAELLAHTLKGVAGTIGASDVEQKAATLEKSISEKCSKEELLQNVLEVERRVEALVERLRSIVRETATASSIAIDPIELAAACDRIVKGLSEHDVEAVDVFQEHAAILQVAFPEYFNALDRSVKSYDFQTALNLLKKARGN